MGRMSDKNKIKKGLGRGSGLDYKSFLTQYDFASTARTHREEGHIIKRQYLFLSDLERNFFYFLEFQDNIVDIREQYRLDLNITTEIAHLYGIRHPKGYENNDVVMTTDFRVTILKNGVLEEYAYSIKPSTMLTTQTLEKLQIEKECTEGEGVKWAIVTERQLSSVYVSNLIKLRENFVIDESCADLLFENFKNTPLTPTTLITYLDVFAIENKLVTRIVIKSFMNLLARKRIRFNMEANIFSINFLLNDFEIL